VRAVDNPTALLILQDPQEQHQAKGTAALLLRCLRRVECRVGERFEPPASLQGLALLYPETPGDLDLLAPPPWPARPPHTLVLLDGTWRKSRRLLYLNPWLQQLPRLALQAPPPSRYAIRRADAPRQRSSLEAAALALAQLEQASARYAPLWQAMDAFIALQQDLAARGR
jgi:DTW domain-containing protein YfiP